MVKRRRSGSIERRPHAASSLALSAALCVASVGCGADSSGSAQVGEGAEIGKSSQPLRCIEELDSTGVDPNCAWRGAWARLLPGNGVDITHTLAPALCSNQNGGSLVVSVDAGSKYNVLQFNGLGRSPSWSVYGTTRTWNSKPACAVREDVTRSDGQVVGGFVIAGKLKTNDSNNNKLFASPGLMAPGMLSENPTFQSGFTVVDNSRSYATGGVPAMAAGSGIFSPSMVMVFMGDDQKTIYAHSHNLPYNSSSWSARITGPTLGSDWVVIGPPAIVRLPVTYKIMVHARRTGSGLDAFFETDFFDNGSDQHYFSNEIGSPMLTLKLDKSAGVITDEPTLSFEPHLGSPILYFRRGTQIMETTYPVGTYPLLAVRPLAPTPTFASAPSATGDVPFDQGTNVVVARTTANQLYWQESVTDDYLRQ